LRRGRQRGIRSALKRFNPLSNASIYSSEDSNEPGEQLILWKTGHLGRYEPFVDAVTGRRVGAECNARTSLSGILAMVTARVMPLGINYAMLVNLFAMSVVQSAQIHTQWYEEISTIDPARRNSDPPCGNI